MTVTGVCLIEPGSEWRPGEDWRAKSFRILLRSPGDVFVLQRPSWWTLEKMLWMVGLLGVIVLGAFAWVANLRRRVHTQTKIIRQKLQAEATLKERYEDLFENANDMVYTHDLKGRITSINTTGEKLLQRSRADILGKNLLEYIAEEQEAAAASWMEQVIRERLRPAADGIAFLLPDNVSNWRSARGWWSRKAGRWRWKELRGILPREKGWSGRFWRLAIASNGGSATICMMGFANNWRGLLS